MDENPDALLFAGGTDLFVKLRHGARRPSCLLCLERMEELLAVREEEGGLFIGAAVSHARLLNDPVVRGDFPVLSRALAVLGSPPIRTMGTIGGNICTASPAADTLPPLYTLDAEVEIRSRDASRRTPIRDFVVAPGKTQLRRGEIVSGVWLKKKPQYNLHHFEKVGQRNALAIAVVSLAAVLTVSDAGVIEEARLAWGSVGPTVVVSAQVEEALIGELLSLETLKKAGRLAEKAAAPIDDVRAGADYRRQVAGNLLLRMHGEMRS
jgi:xanthine dehydrogenase FAD-binding subunit